MMMRISMLWIFLIFFPPTGAQAAPADKEDDGQTPAARAQVEKKYAFIERNLKSSAKFRLSYIAATLYDTNKSGKGSDCFALASAEISKHFSIATAEQKAALIFHAVTSALKKLEADIEEMKKNNAETSTVFDNLNVRANELFDISTSIMKDLKGLTPRTVATIL